MWVSFICTHNVVPKPTLSSQNSRTQSGIRSRNLLLRNKTKQWCFTGVAAYIRYRKHIKEPCEKIVSRREHMVGCLNRCLTARKRWHPIQRCHRVGVYLTFCVSAIVAIMPLSKTQIRQGQFIINTQTVYRIHLLSKAKIKRACNSFDASHYDNLASSISTEK